jgi:hypothetical protein
MEIERYDKQCTVIIEEKRERKKKIVYLHLMCKELNGYKKI